jgi:23S rRNA (uracil1939-C5)-methyltransferase
MHLPEARNERAAAAVARLSELDEIEVTIEKLVFGGEGFGRFEGIPIFVPLAAPGDQLRVRLKERKPGWGRAEIVEIMTPGPDRRPAPCPHFEVCGSCDIQHLTDEAQLRLKAEAVCETLVRLGGMELPPALKVIAGEPLGYRMRAQFQIGETDRGRKVGYFERGSHRLVPIEVCPILVPEISSLIPDLGRMLEGEPHQRLDIVVGDEGALSCAPPTPGLPQGEVLSQVGDFTYQYDARCFFQGHRQLTPTLVATVLGDLEDAEGEAYDLFAGVGLFSLPLARRYRRVVAVEGDRVAARFARRNAKINDLENIEVLALSVDSYVEDLPEDVARVIVDPPRSGLTPKLRRTLIERRPRHLTYVSCHPPTLARDLRELLPLYQVDSLTLLDMFPQTGHLEAVIQLTLKEQAADFTEGS